ncbi:hypothetical protein RDWZM_004909 [Blomia tropicalis]|uniref:Uncharacterized protein n=1 Tax=Blomia tropicalis TaxID=40697 RepID=A0A9Q0M4Z1_BLOTA|nr:hypothetical protein RDWZM_004909 [Blomia tropicalis]
MVKERIFTIMTNEDKQVYELKYEKLDIKRFQLLLNGAKVSKWPDRFTYDKKYDKEFLTKPIIQSFMVQSPVGLGPIIFLATSSGSRLYFEAAKKSTVSKIQKPFPLTQTIISLNDRLQNLFIIDHNNGSCMKLSFKFVEFSMFPLPGNIVQVKNSTKPLLMCSHGDQKISFTNGTKCQKNGKTFNWKLNIGFTDSSYFYLFGTNIVYIFKYELYDNLDTIGPFYVRTFEDFFWNTKKVPPITEHPGDPTDPYNPYNPSNNETNAVPNSVSGISSSVSENSKKKSRKTKVSKVETSKTTKKSKISKTRKKHKKLGTKSALSSIKRKGSSKSRLSAQSSPNRSSKVTTRASKILPKSLDLVSQSMLKSIQTENIMNSKRTKHNSPSFRTGKDTPRRSIKVAGMNSKRTSILIKQAVQSGVKDKSTKIKSSKVSKKMNQSHKQSLSTNPNSSIKKKAAMKSKKGSVNQKSYSKRVKRLAPIHLVIQRKVRKLASIHQVIQRRVKRLAEICLVIRRRVKRLVEICLTIRRKVRKLVEMRLAIRRRVNFQTVNYKSQRRRKRFPIDRKRYRKNYQTRCQRIHRSKIQAYHDYRINQTFFIDNNQTQKNATIFIKFSIKIDRTLEFRDLFLCVYKLKMF